MNFRRLILALAVLALFTGLASAQVSNSGAQAGLLTCNANVAVPPQLRSEGVTELIGDIVITCTGGNMPAPGSQVPTVNITVSLGTQVTSRLTGSAGLSEALLLIDEPGSAVATGPGTTKAVTANLAGPYFVDPTAATWCAASAAPCAEGFKTPNAFQGSVLSAPNQVVFNGIPVMPPVSGGYARVFRITNIRANASALGGGLFAGTTQVLASIAISGSTSLPVNNAVVTAGFIQSGLTTSLTQGDPSKGISVQSRKQCSGSTYFEGMLKYAENFATAFKLRGTNNQNQPGFVYNTESGFTSTTSTPALGLSQADYATRLKAVFNNIPSGVRLFVSQTNIASDISGAGVVGTVKAQMVLNETVQYTYGNLPVATSTGSNDGLNTVELPVVNGTAVAVWEVSTTDPSAIESLYFGVWEKYDANPGANTPPVGTATVNMSYAPTGSGSSWTSASSTLTIPRFVDTSSANNLFSIVLCQTVLLYPFVTNQGGFDTGIAIANTTLDPFGTAVQNGSCKLNWFGSNPATGNPAASDTGNIQNGTVYTTLASTSAAGFQGYMIAVCNFSLAHGFAFISDTGARNLAMGYLAQVVGTGTGKRNSVNYINTDAKGVEGLIF